MDKDSINISKIETYLNSIFDNVISENTIFGYMLEKETIPDEWQDMVMIEMPEGIEDFDAFGQGVVLVWLYARPLSSGRKNVAKMSQLEKKLNTAIKTSIGSNYAIRRRGTYTDYDTDIKWHCNIVELLITIV